MTFFMEVSASVSYVKKTEYDIFRPWKLMRLMGKRIFTSLAGSDCHGTFGKTRVDEMNIPVSQLKLRDLDITEY